MAGTAAKQRFKRSDFTKAIFLPRPVAGLFSASRKSPDAESLNLGFCATTPFCSGEGSVGCERLGWSKAYQRLFANLKVDGAVFPPTLTCVLNVDRLNQRMLLENSLSPQGRK